MVADFQEDRPGPWLAVGIDGGEGHRVRLDEAMADRFLEPGIELPDGIGIEVAAAQAALRIVLAKSGQFGG